MKRTKTVEHIDHEDGNADAWICICGNRSDRDGFFPCDADGMELKLVVRWDGFYLCVKCGRIIDATSLRVVRGQTIPLTRRY